MKKNRFLCIISFVLILTICTNTFAVDDINLNNFNGLNPNQFINNFEVKKDTIDKNNINYEDIKGYIHYYNPEILSNWNTWENNKSANDVYNDYIDAYDKIYDSASSQDSDLQAGMAFAQADAMLIQADKSVSDSYIDFLTYYLRENQLVLSTKIYDINYQKSNFELLNANESLIEALRKEESAKNALEYGSGTELDLLTAKKAVVDANTNIITITSAQKNYKRNLLANCGLSESNEVNIVPINLEEDSGVLNIDFNKDYEYALAHNIQYEIYKRKKENARTEEVKREYEILIDAAPQNIYNDLQTKYMNILDTLNSMHNKEVAYNLSYSNYTKSKNELSSGKISQKEYKTTEYNLNVAKNNLDSIKYDLKIAIENYNAAVNGFGNA